MNGNSSDFEITKTLKSLGTITIKKIDRSTAQQMIKKNHYSHKVGSNHGRLNFGIFRDGKLLGCAMYGYMMHPQAKIFTSSLKNGVMMELNRLWVDDELGKNAESYFIATSIKLIKKINPDVVAIQSFADGRLGCGTIYKASNFKYYGFHYTRFFKDKKTGEVYHNIMITRKTGGDYIKHNEAVLKGDYIPFRVKTYRYVYPLEKSFKMLIGKEQNYPAYDKGEEYVENLVNTELIKKNIETAKKLKAQTTPVTTTTPTSN